MSIRQKLKEIAENASKKAEFDSDIVELGDKILQNWVAKCVEAASEKQNELQLFLFTATTTHNERRVHFLANNGLLDYIREKTELDVVMDHFLLEKKTRLIEKHDDLNFSEAEEFHHFYLIRLLWA